MSGKKKTGEVGVRVVKGRGYTPITKSLSPEQVDRHDSLTGVEWLEPPIDLDGLRAMVSQSTILPQCTRAYRSNIPGFGIGVRYKEDVEETPEMAAEFTKMEELLELLNLDQDTKEVFEDVVEAREVYGIAYLEVIRNLGGEVSQIEFIRDTATMRKTRPLDPYQDADFFYKGRIETRKKKYRKYRQQSNGRTVYFKEFGDKRIMDKRSGDYVEQLDLEFQANEIIEFAIGTMPYGEVRWIGQVLSVDGSRKAEFLNNNYFENGRHTPLMIMVQGGTLTEESFEKLQGYMNDIKGESGQHAFIILETEATDTGAQFEETTKPTIEVKDLASILQKDELFQGYIDNNRRKAQSAFLLPDLYVGYTTDFNRATAQTAMEVTEKQVFQPERKSLEWIINNKLLNEYGFQHVEAYFLAPDMSNPDDLAKILTICNAAGGLTPNKAKQVALNALGEVSEDYPDDWGEIPLQVQSQQAQAQAQANNPFGVAMASLIQKAEANHDDDIVPVLKEIRRLLKARSVMKNEDDGWYTVSGTKVHFGEDGTIDMGLASLREWSGGGGGSGSGSSSGDSSSGSGGSARGGKPPAGFADRMEDYISGGYNLTDIMTKDDVSYIKSHMETTSKPLFRVEDARFTASKIDDLDQVITFEGDLRSFTRDIAVTHGMLNTMSDDYAGIENPVLFRTDGPVQHFNTGEYAGNYMTDQKESLVGGRFKVVDSDYYRTPQGVTLPVFVLEQVPSVKKRSSH